MLLAATLLPGDQLEITTDDGATHPATVERSLDDRWLAVPHLDLAGPVPVRVDVVKDGRQWTSPATAEAAPGGGVALAGLDLSPREVRRTMRSPAPRRRVRCRVEGWAFDVVAVDLSLGGCRITGRLEPLGVGAGVELSPDASTYAAPTWIGCAVVWLRRLPFGKIEAGLRFIPADEEQQAEIERWRDHAMAADAASR